MNLISYGVGYTPIGTPEELEELEELEGVIDIIDPFGLRHIPGQIKDKVTKKVDGYIEQKTQRAASVASARVEQGVKRAMNDASSSAMAFAAGGILVGTVAGGVYFYKRSVDRKAGAR